MKAHKILFFALILPSLTMAQDLSSDFYSFTLNMFNINPAYTGIEGAPKVILNTRQPVRSLAGSPRNNMFGFHGAVGPNNGIGVKLISDARGPFSAVRGDFLYSYTLQFQKEQSLRMGLSAGFINRNFEGNRIENFESLDQSDPFLESQALNSTRFTAGYGMLYTHPRFEVGASLPHILEASQNFNFFSMYNAKVRMQASDKILVEPWVVYQHLPVTQDIFTGFVKGTYDNLIWLQAGIGTNKVSSAAIGFNYWLLNIGYAYQIPNGSLHMVSKGNHQIYLALNLKSKKIPSRANLSNQSQSTELTKVLLRLEELMEQKSNMSDEDMQNELAKIREELKVASKLNADPEKAAEVNFLLDEIAKKISELEAK